MKTAPPQIDEAAFGIVYGSVSVMAVLMVLHPPLENPARQAVVLFGSVFAMALAKAYAEACQRMIASRKPISWADVREVWRHSRMVLLAANGPTLAFALAAMGVLSTLAALILAQSLAIALLVWFGGRIGWQVGGTLLSTLAGAGLTGGLGLLLSLLKAFFH
jgi:hypothetical protein